MPSSVSIRCAAARTPRRYRLASLVGSIIAAALAPAAVAAPIDLRASADAVHYQQDFSALSATPGNDLPPGWQFVETGSGANTSYAAGRGTASSGDTYSFGRDGDRALGSLRTTSVVSQFGVAWRNADTVALTGLALAVTAEQWRLGARDRIDRLLADWSIDASSLTDGTWTALPALDIASLVTSGPLGALAEPASVRLRARLPVVMVPGDTLWLRWRDSDASGADDGLAIDDVTLTARTLRSQGGAAVPEPPSVVLASSALLVAGLACAGRRRRGVAQRAGDEIRPERNEGGEFLSHAGNSAAHTSRAKTAPRPMPGSGARGHDDRKRACQTSLRLFDSPPTMHRPARKR